MVLQVVTEQLWPGGEGMWEHNKKKRRLQSRY